MLGVTASAVLLVPGSASDGLAPVFESIIPPEQCVHSSYIESVWSRCRRSAAYDTAQVGPNKGHANVVSRPLQ